MEALSQAILDILEDMDEYDVKELWNEYCDANRYYEDYVHYMDYLDEFLSGLNPLEIIDRYGDTDTSCDFFKESIHGIETADYISDLVDLSDLAGYMAENLESFNNSEIQDLLDEYDEIHPLDVKTFNVGDVNSFVEIKDEDGNREIYNLDRDDIESACTDFMNRYHYGARFEIGGQNESTNN